MKDNRKRVKVWLAVTCGVIIGIVLLIVILAFTVFKAKRPVNTVDSVTLQDLNVGLDVTRLRVDLNLTLDVDLTVKNPNKVGFKYSNTTALLNYKGQLIGEAPIPEDKISAGEKKGMNLTLTILADRLLSNSELYSDVLSGKLTMNVMVRIKGKVNILSIFKIHVVSSSSCDVTINLSNRSIADQVCQYKTKL
ncbi:Late embryogenesis abundant protein [Quillaja saponaria]|uniref:Late embryogenesis abundant protein n=1 Tax=Quillaja saponaria TaxID=32244 RepID=A0AAD7LMT2_QUISA|nr:Late embryogenesis abundant protein [Quillaja saponaria]